MHADTRNYCRFIPSLRHCWEGHLSFRSQNPSTRFLSLSLLHQEHPDVRKHSLIHTETILKCMTLKLSLDVCFKVIGNKRQKKNIQLPLSFSTCTVGRKTSWKIPSFVLFRCTYGPQRRQLGTTWIFSMKINKMWKVKGYPIIVNNIIFFFSSLHISLISWIHSYEKIYHKINKFRQSLLLSSSYNTYYDTIRCWIVKYW